jgi:hypothetical protein
MRARTIAAVRVTLLILWTATAGLPQPIITTIAGADFLYPVQPLPALTAPLGAISVARLTLTCLNIFQQFGQIVTGVPSNRVRVNPGNSSW